MNRRRLLSAILYIAFIAFFYTYAIIRLGVFIDAEGVARSHYLSYNIEEPTIVETDESAGYIDVYAAGKGYITAFRIDKMSTMYSHGFMVSGGVIPTDNNAVARFYEDVGAVLGSCDVPGATEVRFELCIPGENPRCQEITAPLNLDGCFIYNYGSTEYPGNDAPYVTRADALDVNGNVLCTSTEEDWELI